MSILQTRRSRIKEIRRLAEGGTARPGWELASDDRGLTTEPPVLHCLTLGGAVASGVDVEGEGLSVCPCCLPCWVQGPVSLGIAERQPAAPFLR